MPDPETSAPWLLPFLLGLIPPLLWCAWWLWCVDWTKAWPVLAKGGWAVCVLLGLIVALAWWAVFPRGALLWHLGAVAALACLALFCGWVQGKFGWTPAEVTFDPPTPDHGHGHH
jgi:hypothetical protein